MKTAGLILAGGKSLRLGAHKFQKKLNELTLLERTAVRLLPQVDVMAVNLPRGCQHPDYTILHEPENTGGNAGPLAGVMLGLNWARSMGAEALITMPVDVPFFPNNMVNNLKKAQVGQSPACASNGGRRHGLCALWPLTCEPKFRDAFVAKGVRTVNQMLDILAAKEVVAATEDTLMFHNINTVEDIEIAIKYLSGYKENDNC